jgi:N-acetylneuraminate synthase/N,N'-diacetyllegionaminate synthase
LSADGHRTLAAEAAKAGVAFFSSAISEDMVPLLTECAAAVKIASGDLTFEPVIRAAARSGKPVILSTGLGTTEEIDSAVEWVRDEVGEALSDRLVLLHCVAAYPAPIEQANLRAIPYLADRYGVSVGYSNHVLGIEACLAAVALGATVIETHFTDRKEGRTFRDHALSCDPDDLAQLKARITSVRASLGRYGKSRMPCELPLLHAARKGVVAAIDLPADHVLQLSDLMFARPADEYPASAIGSLVGCKLAKPLRSGQRVRRDALVAER